MNLKKILVGIDGIKAKGEIDREVTTIEKDSRKVVEGSMFFAIKWLHNRWNTVYK